MAEVKTVENNDSVEGFLNNLTDLKRRSDCLIILKLMQQITNKEPKMWGSSIVGFGNYHYKYESGHEGDCFIVGFSPRKQNLSLYLTCELDEHADLLSELGKHKTGKACLYINKLEDVNIKILEKLITKSVEKLSTNKYFYKSSG